MKTPFEGVFSVLWDENLKNGKGKLYGYHPQHKKFIKNIKAYLHHSSSGLGHYPFTVGTGVQIPYGVPNKRVFS